MTVKSKLLLIILLFSFTASSVSATPPDLTWVIDLRNVAFALGWLMMIFMGIKWIVADSPNERADAKKGMIYIVIGLLIVVSAKGLLTLYCDTVAKTGLKIDCSYKDKIP